MPISIDQPKSIRDSTHAMRIAMPKIITHRHEDDNEETDQDMTAELAIITTISLAATYISAGGDSSLVAICGAMLASLVALLKATQEKRDWTEKALNSVGIAVVGSTGPSTVIGYFWPEWASKLTWHVYMLCGFLGGMVGWSIAYAFVKIIGLRSERFANRALRAIEKRISGEDPSQRGGSRNRNHREDEHQ